MESQKTYQEIIEKYNFPSILAQSIATLYDLDKMGVDLANEATTNLNGDTEKLNKESDDYFEKEGHLFYENFLPTLISILKDRSREERDVLKNTLLKCNSEKPFFIGESINAYFDIIETVIQNFNISPKTTDTESIKNDFKLQIANQTEAENEI